VLLAPVLYILGNDRLIRQLVSMSEAEHFRNEVVGRPLYDRKNPAPSQ
jgi:hypothetical protein